MSKLLECLCVSSLVAVISCSVDSDAPAQSSVAAARKAVGEPCAGSYQCAEGEYCTTEDGQCDRPPGCDTGACPDVCYGVCRTVAVPCGPSTCGRGLYCCNESCGICTERDGACIMIACEPIEVVPGRCGSRPACPRGTFCCNPSCGTCTPIGGACLDVICSPTD